MRLLFIFTIITFFANADYLYNGSCVKDIVQGKRGYCYTYSSDGSFECDKKALISDFVDGYNYIDGNCIVSDSQFLGMSLEDYNYSMALLGNFVGFVVLFFSIMLITSI